MKYYLSIRIFEALPARMVQKILIAQDCVRILIRSKGYLKKKFDAEKSRLNAQFVAESSGRYAFAESDE